MEGDDDAWCAALEAGVLDEHGEFPAAGSTALTARQVCAALALLLTAQRALREGDVDEPLLALPMSAGAPLCISFT